MQAIDMPLITSFSSTFASLTRVVGTSCGVSTITVFNEAHGCQSLQHTGDSKVPARVLGNVITDKVIDTPDYAPKELRKNQKGVIIIPPHFPRRTGRPIKRRIRGADERAKRDTI
ncbi:BQ5605_C002g01036 [Microbotryum silenes-dioicae]|uniref:BQ5605_C002g01036 protein n=1 Tax=Microbotryum silenes-dioicae TaxID=796604 RepID=A0A2X0LXI9_9BASI|nr:BQ5605_C002g01036 [Microbotryum silenes-dioicae]